MAAAKAGRSPHVTHHQSYFAVLHSGAQNARNPDAHSVRGGPSPLAACAHPQHFPAEAYLRDSAVLPGWLEWPGWQVCRDYPEWPV